MELSGLELSQRVKLLWIDFMSARLQSLVIYIHTIAFIRWSLDVFN